MKNNKIFWISFMLFFPLEAMLRKFPTKILGMEKKHLRSVTVSVDEQDSDGRTPLHLAVLEDDTNDVKVLLSRGASLIIQDKNGLTPVDYARNNDKLISVRNFFNSLDLFKESRL